LKCGGNLEIRSLILAEFTGKGEGFQIIDLRNIRYLLIYEFDDVSVAIKNIFTSY
jgi:hypothetical protein